MTKNTFSFSSGTVDYIFDARFENLEKFTDKASSIILTDKNVFASHKKKFSGWKAVVIEPGEQYKVQATADYVISELLASGADRSTTLIGVGGGVVTDIAGYVAGIYMRGIRCGFVPTSILAMVDASIGGKNGVDVGVYKNMAGLIRQPSFLFYDLSLLKTLPKHEWVNGFAEVIKHACIKDAAMFKLLEDSRVATFQKNESDLYKIIKRNVLLKTKVVIADEFEKGDRKLLNFGHTFGHAVENLYALPHGHAVSIGMGIACMISEKATGFKDSDRVRNLLKKYGLPPEFEFDIPETLRILRNDKKKEGQAINYVVLDKIGKAKIISLPFETIETLINNKQVS